MAVSLSKLQPLNKGKAKRANRILADVEKILGRAPSFKKESQVGLKSKTEPAEILEDDSLSCSKSSIDLRECKRYMKKKSGAERQGKESTQDHQSNQTLEWSSEFLEIKRILQDNAAVMPNNGVQSNEYVCEKEGDWLLKFRSEGNGDEQAAARSSPEMAIKNKTEVCSSENYFYSSNCEKIILDASLSEVLYSKHNFQGQSLQEQLEQQTGGKRETDTEENKLEQQVKLLKSENMKDDRNSKEEIGHKLLDEPRAQEASVVKTKDMKEKVILKTEFNILEASVDELYQTRELRLVQDIEFCAVLDQKEMDLPDKEHAFLMEMHDHLEEDTKEKKPEDTSELDCNSSLAKELVSQILYDLESFSEDLESWSYSEEEVKLQSTFEQPQCHQELGDMPQPYQPPSSANEKSESNIYSEDRKFYHKILQKVKESMKPEVSEIKTREDEQGTSEGLGLPNNEPVSLKVESQVYDPEVDQDDSPPKSLSVSAQLEKVIKVDELEARECDEAIEVEGLGNNLDLSSFVSPAYAYPESPSINLRVEFKEECVGNKEQGRRVAPEAAQSRSQGEKNREMNFSGNEDSKKALSSPLAPVQSLGLPQAPLGGLAPLRGLVDSSGSTLRGSLGSTASSSGGLELATTQLGSSGTIGGLRAGGLSAGLLGMKHEERVSLTLPGLEEDQEDESQNESPRGTARLMRNLHMDVGSLGGGFEYEESENVGEEICGSHADDVTEPELQNLKISEDEADSLKEVTHWLSDIM
nr:PREDICTED: myosin-1-like [Latimeria chalumnae]|eukprot:XP_014350805.1 PREDICTED: myosin-1-like [Latimeria chalumnae]